MTDFTQYKLGAHPSPRDTRDYHIAAVSSAHVAKLPTIFNLENRPEMPPITDQGQEGCCVGHAVKGVMGFLAAKAGKHRDISSRDSYELGREEYPVSGEGCVPKAALDAGRKVGYCLEADRPYLAQRPTSPGPDAALHRGENHVASYAFAPTDVGSLKSALVDADAPLLMQIEVVDGFYSPSADGRVAYSGAKRGGHEMSIVGYDDLKQAWRIRNSWGTGWGQRGYAWLPYAYPLVEAQTVKGQFTEAPVVLPWWVALFPWLFH